MVEKYKEYKSPELEFAYRQRDNRVKQRKEEEKQLSPKGGRSLSKGQKPPEKKTPIKIRSKYVGGGRAMRGYGKAYMTGGRVGYKGGTLVGKYKTRTGGTGGRSK